MTNDLQKKWEEGAGLLIFALSERFYFKSENCLMMTIVQGFFYFCQVNGSLNVSQFSFLLIGFIVPLKLTFLEIAG